MKLKFGFFIITVFLSLFSLVSTAQSPGQLREVYSGGTVHFANNLEFSKDGNYMVLVVGFNADVFQKNESGFRFLQTIKGGRWQAYNPGISNDGTFICFSNYEDTYVYKRTGESYSLFQTISHPGKSENKDLIMQFDGNEKLMIVGGEGNIRFYELRETSFVEIKRVMNNGNVFQNAALSANGKLMATIDGNGDLQCWNISAKDAVAGPALLKTNKYIGVLDITDDLLLASGTTDSLNLYTVSKELSSATKVYQFPEGKFSEIKFNPDGNRIVIANKSGQLETYAIAGNDLTLEFVNRTSSDNFTTIKMSADSKWLAASSSGGKAVKIFEAPVPIAKPKPAATSKTTAKPDPKNAKPAPATVAAKTATAPKMGHPVIVAKKTNGRFILIDSVSRKPFSEIEYEEAGKSKSGLIYVMKNGHYGVARKDGQIVLNPDTSKYRFVIDSADKAGNYMGYLYDAKRKNLLGDMVLVNKQFQIISRPYSHIMDLEDGFYQPYLKIPNSKNSVDLLFGLLTKEGKEILKPQYKLIDLKKKDKLIHVYTPDPDDKEGLYDYTGKVILSDEYESIEISDEKNNTIKIRKDGLEGFIDKKGKTIVPLKYSSITYMDYGVNSYYSVTLNGKQGVMNTAFKEIIKPEYKLLFSMEEDGLPYYYASKDGIRSGWVDKTGKVILPLIYQEIITISGNDKLSRASISDTSYEFVNNSGKVVFGKKFKDAGSFGGGFTFVKEKDKYGIINSAGVYTVQPIYDDIYHISYEMDKTNMYAAKKDGKWGFLDYSGKLVIPLLYDSPGEERYGYSILEELIAVKQNNKWGYIDRTGKIIIPITYDEASGFREGKAEVTLNGETFYIDKKGVKVK